MRAPLLDDEDEDDEPPPPPPPPPDELEEEDELDDPPLELELLLELLGVELLLLELLELGVEELLLPGVELLLLEDELPSGPFGLSLSHPMSGATPITTPPPMSRRRNSRRSSAGCGRFSGSGWSFTSGSLFIDWSLHCGFRVG